MTETQTTQAPTESMVTPAIQENAPDSYPAPQEAQVETATEETSQEGSQGSVETKENKEGVDENKEHHQNQDKSKNKREDRFHKQLSILAKQQADIRRKQKELEEKEKKFNSNPYLSAEDLRKQADEDPLGAIEKLGLDYNKLTQRILKGEVDPRQKDYQKIQERLDEFEKSQKEREETLLKKEAEMKISNFKTQLKQHVYSNAHYELINSNEEYDTVFEVISQYYDTYGKMLSFDEAAEIVENSLENDLRSKIERLSKTTKAKKWGYFKDQENTQSKEQQDLTTQRSTENRSGQQPTRTLHNNLTTTTPSQASSRRMTEEERLAEAAKLIRFNT